MMNFFLREAWHEFRAGLKGGILPLIYLVLTGYILIVMTSADNLRAMGAVDIPRNAPGLVYLMTSGDAFFLFFAWAWVFAQPIVRDRQHHLHEIVLSAPRSLHSLLAARYTGALGVALVLGTSQILGFLAAPLLESLGAVPAGSVAPAPWFAFGWAALIFTLPLAAGAGALYFIATLKTRSVGGAFAVAAALMAFWMVSMIVLKEGHADPFLTTVLDPSGFAEAERQVVNQWTPLEKSTALLAFNPALMLNRILWCGVPLLLLAYCIRRTTRESLVIGKPGKPVRSKSKPHVRKHQGDAAVNFSKPVEMRWWRAALSEAGWQIRRIIKQRTLWIAFCLLVVLSIAAAFVHGIQHAYGPMQARTEFMSPILMRTFYLIIVFMVAAMVGMAARRDEQPGLCEMLDAAAAPDGVRLLGRAAAALVVVAVCVAIPATGVTLVAVLTGQTHNLALPYGYMFSVLMPAILELAAITLVLHALIRNPGTAHAASVLAAFIMVVNFEVGLVNYPPLQFGRGVEISLSGLTGFGPWLQKLILNDGFKFSLVIVLLAFTAMFNRRGTDESFVLRCQKFGRAAGGRAGIVAVVGIAAMFVVSSRLHQHYVTEGGYETDEERLAKDAAWEQRWLPQQSDFSVAGGDVSLTIHPADGELRGEWHIDEVRTAGTALHASLPNGFELSGVRVNGEAVEAVVDEEHLAIPLSLCNTKACSVDIHWRLSSSGWDAGPKPSWMVGQAYWLRAIDVMPRLGFASERVTRTPQDRADRGLPADIALPNYLAAQASEAAAPRGLWRWSVRIDGTDAGASDGQLDGLLDFAVHRAPTEKQTLVGKVTIHHDDSHRTDATDVAEDLAVMQACVARHLGQSVPVNAVVQWPRGLPPGNGDAALSGKLLLLSEEPHWDIAPKGPGRHIRRADIASALAKRQILDSAALRDGLGAQWISSGLSGAIGLLCVAETDGVDALHTLLARGAQRTTEALAVAETPVGSLAQALPDEWAPDYAPLTALHWASRLSPQDTQGLLKALRTKSDIPAVLAERFGTEQASLWLGLPNATDVHVGKDRATGERWVWSKGGWQEVAGSAPSLRQVHIHNGHVVWSKDEENINSPKLTLDDWPAYEREPKDNRR